MGIYERFGVTPIVNAAGAITRYGGAPMLPEVLEAMQEAASATVNIDELEEKAGSVIARATGAEDGIVTAGAAGALLVGTAACLTGNDSAKMHRLPDTTGLRNQLIMHRAHRNGYDHSMRAAGVHIVEVGYGHTTFEWQLESAITEQTAAIAYVLSPWVSEGALPLSAVVKIAKRPAVPVIVDGAAMLPPPENLKRFIAEGSDLVCFSAGKALRGPQGGGILCGRHDLVRAAALNMSPNHSIGRSAKVSKEAIVGTLVALENYLARDHAADMRQWKAQAERMAGTIRGGTDCEVRLKSEKYKNIPLVEVSLGSLGRASDIQNMLRTGIPPVYVMGIDVSKNTVTLNPHALRAGEDEIVGRRFVECVREPKG
jgi:D-glucosaminate-6-phosphate ammonia-lyase